jgi:type II secretory pathway pseudopilin PulG
MRKLMMAVVAVAGLGLVTGCQQKSDVQSKREDVAEAQRDVAKEQQNANQEVAETRQDAQKDVADAQRNLAEEQSDLAKTEHQDATDNATGGSGMTTTKDTTAKNDTTKNDNVKTEEVKGTIKSASASNLTLIVPDKNNQMMKFNANQQVQVTKDDKPMALTDLKPGDEVRASYTMDANGQMVLRSIDVTKVSAQHPGVKAK